MPSRELSDAGACGPVEFRTLACLLLGPVPSFSEEVEPTELEQTAPNPTVYPYFDRAGFATMTYSGSGDVSATAQGVDLLLPPGAAANTSTSGCEAGIYGDTAGDPYNPCYHRACDTFDNISLEALDQMSDAAAHAVLTFAMTTSSVNGTDKGKGMGKFKNTMEYRGPNLVK